MPLWGDSKNGFRRIAFPSVTLSVAQKDWFVPSLVDIVLPIYTERDVTVQLPRLLPPVSYPGRMSRVSILLTWLNGAGPRNIKEMFPDNGHGLSVPDATSPLRIDRALLRLQFDDVVPTVAYGAIEFESGDAANSDNLLFAAEFESGDSLRPRRWICRDFKDRLSSNCLEARATKRVRKLAGNRLAWSDSPRRCYAGNWHVGLDYCAFDSSTKEYVVRGGPDPPQMKIVENTSKGVYEEIFIVAQFRNTKRQISEFEYYLSKSS